MIGTLNNKKLNGINFPKVTKISITGLDDKNNFQLKKNLNFLKNSNLFFINKKKINEIIIRNTLVEKYSVFKRYPSSIDIIIKKTNFLAQIQKDGKIFLLGSNGKLTKTINIRDDLPFIFGDFEIKNFFELMSVIDKTNFSYTEIKNFFFFKSGRWDLEMNSGLLIKLPKKKLRRAFEFSNIFLLENKKKEIYKIDLRQLNQIVINER